MSKRLPLVLLIFSVAAFVFGLFELMQLRLETGDVYPEYSSLRSDPLGAMAFCESLEKLPVLSVTRDFSESGQLPNGRDTTYLHLGARTFQWLWRDEVEIKEIEGFVTGGGRLAISFFPETTRPFRWFDDPEQEPEGDQKKAGKQPQVTPSKQSKKKKQLSDQTKKLLRRTSLKARWGLDFGYLPLASEKPGQSETLEAVNRTELALPESLEWHSSTIFTNLPAAWHVVYARGTNPVVVERKFGAGTIVMATDSYFLSNEALLKDRHPDLLAWWVGPNKQIIFDEAHFGILETSGVAKLIRKYHLQGLIAGLILLAALFIWKNSCSFVPPYEEEERPDFVVGKDSAAGFVNLLRRNVPGRKLLEVCFEEWKKSFAQTGPRAAEKQARAQAVLTAENAGAQREHEQVQTYREICNILKKT